MNTWNLLCALLKSCLLKLLCTYGRCMISPDWKFFSFLSVTATSYILNFVTWCFDLLVCYIHKQSFKDQASSEICCVLEHVTVAEVQEMPSLSSSANNQIKYSRSSGRSCTSFPMWFRTSTLVFHPNIMSKATFTTTSLLSQQSTKCM